ncbi:YrdC domain-containing protein, mitochondrial [Eufriesea mexicana]|uniref:Threonylcarbamoyl-AMP synthase n=2 Tax=Eufriesea mexicana TaxID=516756 RepID=A0A310SFE7_9HYME|nr:PREDICTED: yrdC domain-containing protein, mitochondrial isoform X2 [Eufriesea mexicana]OAD52949.1 YrdC domain-containing protein, mitochondrial [Eufriesea mexicana]
MATFLENASEEIQVLSKHNKHWTCKGKRSIAIAAKLLEQNEIIAIPTDTIYGLAGTLSSTSIKKLYEIKQRDINKPLSISVNNVKNIKQWGIVDHLSDKMLTQILPGPYTIILKRTAALNPALNPNHDTIGIRVPKYKFINCVSKIVGPLVLSSANISNEKNCLYASEFKHLWPTLGGIFHDSDRYGRSKNSFRKGSTIVDLSEPQCYKIIRHGIGKEYLISLLEQYHLQNCFS